MSQQWFGRNERGREIQYDVFATDAERKCKTPTFSYTAKRFSVKRLIEECKKHGIKGPIVIVSYITLNKWGMNFVERAFDIHNGKEV